MSLSSVLATLTIHERVTVTVWSGSLRWAVHHHTGLVDRRVYVHGPANDETAVRIAVALEDLRNA